ncbi:MAG: hypothetical protein M1821_000593 [Bathelium mastoideum]|nr:MAG: hypothetical protein M1821_000593 [Bathelium mastoideum]
MSASALFSQYLLPQAAVSLGRLVINVNEPHQDFHDPGLDPKPYIIEQFLNQYDGTNSSTDQSEFASELTSILSSWFSKHAKVSVRVTSDQIKTVYLINTGEWFRNAMKPEATRKWVERTIDEGEDIYLITGYHSLLDARIMEHTGEQRDSGGKLILPVSEALAASGVVIAMGNIVDPGFTASSIRAEGGQREFVAKGE